MNLHQRKQFQRDYRTTVLLFECAGDSFHLMPAQPCGFKEDYQTTAEQFQDLQNISHFK
uniref:Uncharacterized protein n=1 Tax=Arundo donax TaxID=35708 RepID=A0A0A9FGT7_ARUDO